ncbi:hypothetical protein [Thorsellia anophelis]|uniref:Uncharacterized protein n=1 Tax=Thorsellia anophelis DSM 18579 TaxID=1123402 RepID=A0A1I0F340_9GAMM|nr:hypothetical protein [Thorsellia anophelis]SET52448.1 hypothetical protein SAMN02583745_02623 [Thorsellia anophelis DSM 18579]
MSLKIKKIALIGLSISFLLGNTSIAFAELKFETDRAHCAGYADAMLSTYKNRHYNMMSQYYGEAFEQDGSISQNPEQLQSLYDTAYDSINKKARIRDNLDPLCEDDYVAFIDGMRKQFEEAKLKEEQSN